MERHPFLEPYSKHPLITHLSFKAPSNVAPSMFPNKVPMGRDALSPEPMVYSFIYMSESPVKELSQEMGEKHKSPKGSFTTLLSLHQCHAAFSTIPST